MFFWKKKEGRALKNGRAALNAIQTAYKTDNHVVNMTIVHSAWFVCIYNLLRSFKLVNIYNQKN